MIVKKEKKLKITYTLALIVAGVLVVAVVEVRPHHNVYHGRSSDKYTGTDHVVHRYKYHHSNKVISHMLVVVLVEEVVVLQLIEVKKKRSD